MHHLAPLALLALLAGCASSRPQALPITLDSLPQGDALMRSAQHEFLLARDTTAALEREFPHDQGVERSVRPLAVPGGHHLDVRLFLDGEPLRFEGRVVRAIEPLAVERDSRGPVGVVRLDGSLLGGATAPQDVGVVWRQTRAGRLIGQVQLRTASGWLTVLEHDLGWEGRAARDARTVRTGVERRNEVPALDRAVRRDVVQEFEGGSCRLGFELALAPATD